MIVFYNAWVLATLATFYWGPIEWPGANQVDVALYVLLCLLAFDVAYFVSRNPDLGRAEGRPRWTPRTVNGARALIAVYVALNLMHIFFVTGKNPMSLSAYSLDFGAVYDAYGENLADRSVTLGQQLITLAKAVVFPFALITFIHRFRTDKWTVVGFLAPMGVSSLLRGTDKEVVDILLCLVVALYCHRLLTRRTIILLAAVPLAGALFVSRRISRFNDSLPACLPDSTVCFDYSSGVASIFGPRAEVFWVFVSNYITNGYQGLSYALSLPWTPNLGVGHLPPVKRTLCLVSDTLCTLPDYQSNLTGAGWDASARWTSVYPVLANDLSFWLVPLYTGVLGVVLARCLKLWHSMRDPRAGAALVLVTMFWVYSSANMQIAISLDWAVATVLLLYVSPWTGRARRIRA